MPKKIDNKKKQKKAMQTDSRAFALVPNSFNPETRTFEVDFTTGARVKRYNWNTDQYYYEELSVVEGEMNLSRLNNGAPFLDNHSSWGGVSKSVFGVVERAWVQDKTGKAQVKLSKRSEIDGVVQDIQDGILRNVSVGYSIKKWKEMERAEDGLKVFRAIDWEPYEISLVPSGADDQAKIRAMEEAEGEDDAQPTSLEDKEVVNSKEQVTIKEESQKEQRTNTNGVIDMTPEEIEKMKQEAAAKATRDEQERSQAIRSLVSSANLEMTLADSYIKENKTLEQVRALVLDEVIKGQKPAATNVDISVGDDQTKKRTIEGIANNILVRGNPSLHKVSEQGKEFHGLSIVDSMRSLLHVNGVKNVHMMNPMAVAERALSTSDFKNLLEDVINKSLRASYAEKPQTFAPFVKKVQVSDFKTISRTQYGDAPELQIVKEGGQSTYGKISDAAEKYNVETYAKKLLITRKAIINDDLSAFVQTPEKFGRAARQLESKLVWNLVTSNPTMADGVALFASGHSNLGSAGAINVANVGALWSAMRKQKGIDGKEFIDISPKFLVVPVALETLAMQFIGTTVPQQDSNFNPYKSLNVVAEPRLDDASATNWFLFSAASEVDMIELATLQGLNGPMIVMKDLGGVSGVECECIYDVGVGLIDYRGFQKNPN